MGKQSKFFRAFVEGTTISDGRTITRDMIDSCVATFNAQTYTPRINVEHISGYSPEPPFNGYGSVTAVKAEDVTLTIAGKQEKRYALYAQVDANDQLVDLSKRDQKPYPSVELTDSYAGTGKVGLIGLAFTDRPASIGTESLKFSRTAPATVFAIGDEAPTLEFEADPVDPKGLAASVKEGMMSAFTAIFSTRKEDPTPPPAPPTPSAGGTGAQTPANDNFAVLTTAIADTVAAQLKPVLDGQTAAEARFQAIEAKLDTTPAPDSFSRTPATGGGAALLTDC